MSILGIIAASGKGAVTFYVYGSGTPAVHGTFIPDGFYNGFPRYARLDSLLMVWGTEDGEYVISDYGNYNIANCYFRNNKQTGVTPWEGTNWMAVEGSGVPIVSLTPPSLITLYVYGAGTTAVNGTYVETGSYGGHPLYVSQDGLRMICWLDSRYRISDFGNYDAAAAYYGDNDITAFENAWDVVEWKRANGDVPLPTVSLTPEPSEPIAMNISGAGTGSYWPLDIPYIDVTNGKSRYYLEHWTADLYELKWEPTAPPFYINRWSLWINGLLAYYSIEDVAYPSDVVTWICDKGEPPLPTVTAVY